MAAGGNPTTNPWSSGSYGDAGTFVGEIVSINDPSRKNRVQVRIHGYQSDKGLIPDDKLSWYPTVAQDSQLAGAGSTHNYYPGAKVIMGMAGTEMMVHGATAGYDSDSRSKDGSPDSGSNQNPDVPRQAQGGGGPGSGSGGEGKDSSEPTSRDPKVDKPLKQPEEEDAYKDSKDRAPFKKGEKAKKPDDKSIGILKNKSGDDILNVIDGMDDNKSGAVKEGTKLIRKLRQSDYGTSKEMIGAGSMIAAASQFPSDFSPPPLVMLLPIVLELLACFKILRDGTDPKLIDITRIENSLRPTILNVNPDILSQIDDIRVTVKASKLVDNTGFLIQLRQLYSIGLAQAFTSILNYLQDTAGTASNSGTDLVALFNDPKELSDLTAALASLGPLIGISSGDLLSAITKSNATGNQNTSGSQGNASQLSSFLNMFMSNPVAQSEGQGGGINPQSLLKIPLKYAKKKVNDPQQSFGSLLGG